MCRELTEAFGDLLVEAFLIFSDVMQMSLNGGWSFGELVYGSSPTRVALHHL